MTVVDPVRPVAKSLGCLLPFVLGRARGRIWSLRALPRAAAWFMSPRGRGRPSRCRFTGGIKVPGCPVRTEPCGAGGVLGDGRVCMALRGSRIPLASGSFYVGEDPAAELVMGCGARASVMSILSVRSDACEGARRAWRRNRRYGPWSAVWSGSPTDSAIGRRQ